MRNPEMSDAAREYASLHGPSASTPADDGSLGGHLSFNNLRDDFAMAALQGLLACNTVQPYAGEGSEQFMARIAAFSYRHADSMLEARRK